MLREMKKVRRDNMKSLVIYFSHTGENYMSDGIRNIDKGNTEVVAEKIKELTDADLFEIEPIKEYPYHYQECCDIAKEELENNDRPELKVYLENIDEYETIYIGYPIWWGTCPVAVFTQLEKLDFEGKIVKPFATHEGSGLGNSMNDIRKYCKNAEVREGLAIRGSNVEESQTEIENWIRK